MLTPSLDDLRELVCLIQRSNDLISGAVRERDADAARLAAMRAELDAMRQQSARSESLTRNLLAKAGGGASSAPPASTSAPRGSSDLASMAVADLVRLGRVVGDQEEVSSVNARAPRPAQQQQPPLSSIRNLNEQRARELAQAEADLEEARSRSFQARLHALDRLRSKAVESVAKLGAHLHRPGAAPSASIWGPRATAAFYHKDAGGGCAVSSDSVDDALRLGVACWLEWAENRLHNETDDAAATDDDDGEGEDDPNRVSQLYRSLLVASEFTPTVESGFKDRNATAKLTACAADLQFVQQLAAAARARPSSSSSVGDDDEEDEHTGVGGDAPHFLSVAEWARSFFEEQTLASSWPSTRVGVLFR